MCNLALPGKHPRGFQSLQQLDRRLESLERRSEQHDDGDVPAPRAAPPQTKPRLTACHFGRALGLWKGQRFKLWQQKSGLLDGRSAELVVSGKDRLNGGPDERFLKAEMSSWAWAPRTSSPREAAMMWGLGNEVEAIEKYSKITGNIVNRDTVFTIYKENDELYDWLGGLPDGLVEEEEGEETLKKNSGLSEILEEERKNSGGDGILGEGKLLAKNSGGGGILEVKCPHRKVLPCPLTLPYFYVPQAQGLMEILDREWLDFYFWTPGVSSVLRIKRDRDYWGLIFRVMSEFWWSNVVPARQERERGSPEAFMPSDTHPLTPAVIERSQKIASRARVIWTDYRGGGREEDEGSFSYTILKN
ncbi:hypothetical protein SELMODRAFT_403589 [Selaginella moellendorffii]|uniref:Uncharacterized protein n=1 Tax=Selaginella moellendorffii TaxID=88036 RepID=D8QRW2_SELML|nr:uncharacterized protein LOC9630510 [Selaginella moellendorffii]EFJ37329.1 hypothetical protein SELMODRAFT_403589 [Selaginella moellendorffii]|eukprot:XP_002962069.1 uncharacterized protein LOC9630510 [Selaginella moellendorffii]